MASTYSTRGRLEKQGSGENSSTWGTKLNTVIDLIDEWSGGYVSVAATDGGTKTLSANLGASDESRQKVINITGSLSGTSLITVPDEEGFWIVLNSTSGGQTVTFKTVSGTGVNLTAAKYTLVYSDGTNCIGITLANLAGLVDMDGGELILDADADTSLTADTDDVLDLRMKGADLYRWDGDAASPVNGMKWTATASGSASIMEAYGSDTNIDAEVRSKGSGDVVLADDSGNEILVAADVASAVNELTVTNAAAGDPLFIGPTGGDTNIDFELRSKGTGDVILADVAGNEILVAADVASAVNELTVTNAAAGSPILLNATGGDTNIGVTITPKGSGVVILDGLTFPAADGSANQIVKTNGSGVLSFVTAKGRSTLISETTISSGTSVEQITAKFSATYDYYIMEWLKIYPTTNDKDIRLRFLSGSTTSITAGYEYYGHAVEASGGAPRAEAGQAAYIELSDEGVSNTAANNGCNGTMIIYNPYVAGPVSFNYHTVSAYSGGGPITFRAEGFEFDGTVRTGVEFYAESGNLEGGVVRIWGVN